MTFEQHFVSFIQTVRKQFGLILALVVKYQQDLCVTNLIIFLLQAINIHVQFPVCSQNAGFSRLISVTIAII